MTAALTVAASATVNAQSFVAHFDMSPSADGKISELTTNNHYTVYSQLPVCASEGIDGLALRFDGYSNYVKAGVSASSFSKEALTLSVVLAAESYPMMKTDVAEETPTFATICGNLTGKEGIALQLSSQGDLRFQFGSAYANGYLFTINGTEKLPLGQWCHITVVLDKAGNSATLYLDGRNIGSGRMNRSEIVHGSNDFYIGKDDTELKWGPFLINTFCGLIDDIAIRNEAVAPSVTTYTTRPDFNYPASRYEASLWRPQFHAMPSGSWTNESHGMLYSGGKYHVFFQKNANGPYMSRLHWGHISSENLYDWQEEVIAIAPGESYDIKGCWSGCLYDDNGTPTLFYTAVDNARAVIAEAQATDDNLIGWQKKGIAINGRPQGLSDDFRDPYFFTANGQKYIIVGTSKNGIGACTLHKYENGSWTNDGTLFFQGTSSSQHGTFWEMPNLTDMGNGKWLFTCTPLNTALGVRTLCWTGTIGADGKFTPDANGMQYLEMNGISRDGYGLLSPTIYQKDGKTLLLGIVPDKLPTETNYQMGWAHNFSLPREISIGSNGQIEQKPYSGLAAMRTTVTKEETLDLNGTLSLSPVSGRQMELLGEFTVSNGDVGFHFLKSGDRQATLGYNTDTGLLTLDLSALDRQSNDGGSYNGVYAAYLPEKVKSGEKLTLHVFVDGSIADIFVNDRWAFSVRLFPTVAGQTEAEVFATAATATRVQAWTLDAKLNTGISTIEAAADLRNTGIYDLTGRRLETIPQKGIYIKDGKKYVAR